MQTDNKIVHSLWIGKKLSPLELLTIHSFLVNGHEFWLWIYEPLDTPLPLSLKLKDANEIIPYKQVFSYQHSNQYGHGKGSYAGFSDIFRYLLLYKYGGWWADMDVTCLKPLDFDTPYVFRKHHVFPAVGNIMKCPVNSQLMYDCYNEAVNTINKKNKDWNKPIDILNKNIHKHNLQHFIQDFSNPDQWSYVRNFLLKPITLPEHYKVIHWINEEWRRHRINKHYAKKESMYYYLMNKYKINTLNNSEIQNIILSFKLTNIYSFFLLITKPKALFKTLMYFMFKR